MSDTTPVKKPTTPVKKKSGSKKLDEKKLNMIFLGILIVGAIIFTIIILRTPSKTKKYYKVFGTQISSTIEVNEDKKDITIIVDVNGTKIEQKGSLDYLNKDSEYTYYEATLEPRSDSGDSDSNTESKPEIVQIKVNDKILVLAYDSGEVLEYSSNKDVLKATEETTETSEDD